MDEHLFELAQERAERYVVEKVKAVTAKPGRESATNCEACGAEIPEKRRELVPGVSQCVNCQSLSEQKAKHYR